MTPRTTVVANAAPPIKIDIPATATQMATALKSRNQAAFWDSPGKTKSRRSLATTVRHAPEKIARPSCLQFLFQAKKTPMVRAMITFVSTPTE
jgi:hypothetical protein